MKRVVGGSGFPAAICKTGAKSNRGWKAAPTDYPTLYRICRTVKILLWFLIWAWIFFRKVLMDGRVLRKKKCDGQRQSEQPNPARGTDIPLVFANISAHWCSR
jgi:hypothetical protein